MMERFSGDADQVRKFLEKVQEHRDNKGENSGVSRRQKREELQAKYATQLAQLNAAGINVSCPCTLRQLEKHQGNIDKV